MNIRIILTIVAFVCISLNVTAQETPYTWRVSQDETRYIYADTAYVRASPDTKQSPLDTLLLGQEVKALETTEKTLSLKRLDLPWVKVTYSKNGEEKSGYIWQGLLSFPQIRRGETKFIFGVERMVDTTVTYEDGNKAVQHKFVIKLKIAVADKLTTSSQWKIPADESSGFSQTKVMSGLGLSNVQHIIVISFGGEACGIATEYYYHALTTDGRLMSLPSRMEVGDAGVYYHTESFVFPAEKNGRPDIITKETEEGEDTEKTDKQGNVIYKITRSSVGWIWDSTTGYKEIKK
ncbi:SH3 domain-containing protein [Chitinophaga solisilvae]|uniref:SH3 domain-containing protein n=1 Tax=Chitinophaga solisilvae TaxID=1233460 RepID=UPI00136D1391|nr:SH3 domain-containing protein [Chitinophaga solisilvae]